LLGINLEVDSLLGRDQLTIINPERVTYLQQWVLTHFYNHEKQKP